MRRATSGRRWSRRRASTSAPSSPKRPGSPSGGPTAADERDRGAPVRNPKILVLDRGEELAAQLQGLADDFRPTPDVVACTRVGAVAEVLEDEGPFDVLVAGPSLGTRSGLS